LRGIKLGPRELPAIKVEAKINGKKVSKNFKATMNTSLFANQITNLLEASDNKEIAIQVKTKKAKAGLGERLLGKIRGREEEDTSLEEGPLTPTPPENPLEDDDKEKKLRLG